MVSPLSHMRRMIVQASRSTSAAVGCASCMHPAIRASPLQSEHLQSVGIPQRKYKVTLQQINFRFVFVLSKRICSNSQQALQHMVVAIRGVPGFPKNGNSISRSRFGRKLCYQQTTSLRLQLYRICGIVSWTCCS